MIEVKNGYLQILTLDMYHQEIIPLDLLSFKNFIDSLDISSLDNFLDENIIKIEKLNGKFIKNIFIVIENEQILQTQIGIKKKSYKKNINYILLLIRALLHFFSILFFYFQ